MTFKTTFSLFLGLFSLVFNSYAQQICGLLQEDDHQLIERTIRNKAHLDSPNFSRSQDVRHIPIVYHVIRNSEGQAGVAIAEVHRNHCAMNEFYLEQGTNIQFFLAAINEIENTAAYEDHYNAGESVLSSNKINDVINVFIPQTANYNPDGIYDVAGYYTPSDDWVVVGQSNLDGTTLFHEIGHYLSLPHTFRGWDWEPYDPDVHGEQVGTFSPSGNRNELADGSNCDIAGDRICDTPADYNHYGPNWGCNYNGGAKDPNGNLINPDEDNMMSYFLSCNQNKISQGQADVMNADIDMRIAQGNLYEVPNVSVIDLDRPYLLEPMLDEQVQDNNGIVFSWEEIPGADYYEIWIDLLSSFGFSPEKLIVEENELIFDGSGLFPNRTYYWKVIARNSTDFCSEWSDLWTFETNELTSALSDQGNSKEIKVFPNPLTQSSQLIIENTVISDIQKIALYNAAGQFIENPSVGNSSSQRTQINIKSIPAGIYFLELLGEDFRLFEKIVVL